MDPDPTPSESAASRLAATDDAMQGGVASHHRLDPNRSGPTASIVASLRPAGTVGAADRRPDIETFLRSGHGNCSMSDGGEHVLRCLA
ncbi:hypothetical protein [Natrinema pallidum]|uniref:Uncharacterized protein n=1 Tax=Natrinema pallidum TaxID=69527 RepID=A0A4P9TJP7_9EURY|nr:hypothetical protein [Natrinema pallidum]QCW04252.1 hypothetical protein FGF80_13880 [Natrinema pallidum]